ncbi:MAG: hypothetical protein ACOX52_09550 [Verrucomicrobiota bacterium]
MDGREWLLVGEIDGHRSETFTVPDALLPAKEIWVRLSGRKQAQPGQPPVAGGSSQVYGYRYSARLDRSPGDVTGATRFVAVAAANADVDVAIQDLGTCPARRERDAHPGREPERCRGHAGASCRGDHR